MLSENLEFMADLDNYNFDKLVNEGYSFDEVNELKKFIKIIY
ncbi:MAG: hypothetical protein RR523_13805 [Cetobacterium sp.]